jgi:HD-like signal output (HDOD) protein
MQTKISGANKNVELPIRTSQRLVETVAGAKLPPMSGIAAQLVATLSEDQVDLTFLRDLIAQDPALAASVLRWANSPIYGTARKVNTLDAAISILGISKVRARAIAFFITNAFEPPLGLDRDAFWASCMHSAGYAMWIALAVGLNESEAWLTALLVRLGELVIGGVDRPTLQALEATPLPLLQRWQQEQQHFGFDEGEVMAEVGRLWFFPESMVEALQKCAKPLHFMAFSPLGAVVHLAMLLAEQEAVDEASLQQLPQDVIAALGIEMQWMAQHIPERATFTASKLP